MTLVYTGNEHAWNDEPRYLAGPGMAGDASRWLADRGVVAVGADNMAWDVIGLRDPEFGCTLPGHLLLLAQRGIYIIENLRLGALAAAQCVPIRVCVYAAQVRRRHRLAGAPDRDSPRVGS